MTKYCQLKIEIFDKKFLPGEDVIKPKAVKSRIKNNNVVPYFLESETPPVLSEVKSIKNEDKQESAKLVYFDSKFE